MSASIQGKDERRTAVLVFAHYLGIDIDTEPDLVAIAEEALDNLPEGWQLGLGEDENAGIPYFYNDVTGESSWHHPQEKRYMKMVRQEKQYLAEQRLKNDKKASERKANNQASPTTKGDLSKRQTDRKGWTEANPTYQNKDSNNKNKRNDFTKEKSLLMEAEDIDDEDGVVEMLDIEDFEENDPVPARTTNKGKNAASPKLSKQSPATVTTKAQEETSSAFAMKASDFFDEPIDQPAASPDSHWNRVKESNASKQENKSKNVDNQDSVSSTVQSVNRHITGQSLSDDRAIGKTAARTASPIQQKTDQQRSSSNPRSTNRDAVDRLRLADSDEDDTVITSLDNRLNERDHRDDSRGRLKNKSKEERSSNDRDRYDTRDKDRREHDNMKDKREIREEYREKDREKDRFSSSRNKSIEDNRSASAGRSNKRDSNEMNPTTQNTMKYNDIDQSSTASQYVTTIQRLELELLSSQEENRVLQRVNKEIRNKYDEEIEFMKKSNKKLDDLAIQERDDRKLLQEKLLRIEQDKELLLREKDDEYNQKIRDMTKKIRLEVEEEWKDRLKSLERRSQEEKNEISSDLIALKRRYEETQKEIEIQKKRIIASKEDGKLEIMTELEDTKQSFHASEEKVRLLSGELKKLREDYVTISSRLTGTLQQIQVYASENETLKVAHTSAINDSTSTNHALVHATQRVAAMDIDISNLRAEIVLLKRENEELASSNRKLSSNIAVTSDRLSTNELETKRIKQSSINEINRLNARIIELESINQQQNLNLDKNLIQENEMIREIQKKLSKSEYSNNLLQEQINDKNLLIQKLQMKILNYEKTVQSMEENLYKKEQVISDHQMQLQLGKDKYNQLKESFEKEINSSIQLKREYQDQVKELQNQQKNEIARIQNEVTEKLPTLVSLTMQQMEAKWANKLALGECIGDSAHICP